MKGIKIFAVALTLLVSACGDPNDNTVYVERGPNGELVEVKPEPVVPSVPLEYGMLTGCFWVSKHYSDNGALTCTFQNNERVKFVAWKMHRDEVNNFEYIRD